MIEIRDLRKSFKAKTGTVTAVDGVSFSARDGEITGLLGPNGAGKTTTLRMLYTLMTPDHGHVLVDALDAQTETVEVRRRLGVLPDSARSWSTVSTWRATRRPCGATSACCLMRAACTSA